MCGTDYNENVPNIGPKKAYKLLQKYKTIDGISENTELDVSILNHERGRELFRDYKKVSLKKIPLCGIPNFNRLHRFTKEHNINCSFDNLKIAFSQPYKIVFT